MKKKTTILQLNKKQIGSLNSEFSKGGFERRTNFCPVETINITMCYGANNCQKWPPQD